MKIIAVTNGWAVAPHCWRQFLFHPVRVQRIPGHWTCVELFGFAFFFEEAA